MGWEVENTFSNTYKNTTFCSIKNIAQIPGKNAEEQYLWENSMFVLQSKKIFGAFLKIRKQEKILQTDPHKTPWSFFYLLTYFPLITSVTELYSYHRKLNLYKFSLKLLKGGKFRKISKSIASSLHYKNKNLALAPENWTKLTFQLYMKVLHYSIS